jgi:hypothetical protein
MSKSNCITSFMILFFSHPGAVEVMVLWSNSMEVGRNDVTAYARVRPTHARHVEDHNTRYFMSERNMIQSSSTQSHPSFPS